MHNYKVDILAFGAHPDDVECAVSGTILKHIALGKSVAIIDLTAGEMGTYGTPEERKIEAANAAKILGIKHREQLELIDGAIENNTHSRHLVIEAIRKYKPEIILCNAIQDNHPDHSNASKLVANANFISGLKKYKTFQNKLEQTPWRAPVVYNYIQDYFIEPDFVIDISENMDKKMKSIMAYKSQFEDPNDKNPNSIMGLLNQIKSMNSIYGRPINSTYAEGFTVNKYIGVNNLFQLT